ncbi:MAG TPA: FdtA/QdtA family cupin domain-containing protein [Chitinophagaceae bacterium]|nr:FdtA/QdtA family cupin domain-containing protein [Chitinophagaceae bacterium]
MDISTNLSPCLIQFNAIGSSELGYITAVQHPADLPFIIKRVYWTYFTPHNVERGNHAHRSLHQVLVAVSGIIKFTIEGFNGNKTEFILDDPNTGLYLPPMHWRTIHFSHNAILLCLASEEYRADDYIREYNEFKKLITESPS